MRHILRNSFLILHCLNDMRQNTTGKARAEFISDFYPIFVLRKTKI